jgi:hypothetical protein
MRHLFCALLLALPFCALAQKNKAEPHYPQDYFRNPLDIPIFLAGNFGECRPGHFHSGTDIKTLGKENQPVHAAADGYISRIKMEKGGFGHGLYITHPNGYTTLYAHLNDFAPAIQKYVRDQQYEKKHWDVDLQFTPAQFPVKKGQLIAWSGNTGASTAPHLHFEIRDTKTEHPLNPELFGLPIIDHIAPVPAEIAIYDMSKSIYEQDPTIAALRKKDSSYVLKETKGSTVYGDTITVNAATSTPLIGISVNADDFMEGSDNTLAFLSAKLYLDDSLQTAVTLDDIGYDVTRYINAYADYKTHEQKGKWFQCMFRLPGNDLYNIYTYLNKNNGGLSLDEETKSAQPHKITIRLTDDRNNSTNIVFYIAHTTHQVPSDNTGTTLFKANQVNSFSDPNVQFSLGDHDIYDNVNFRCSKSAGEANTFSDRYHLHYSYVPVHHSFGLSIKPTKPVPFALRTKMAIMYSDGKSSEGSGAAATDDGWYKTSVRAFGNYWLAADTTAPVISSLQKNGANLSTAKQITFAVRDAMTSVRSFSGYLDGKWICFEEHNHQYFYKFDAHCPKGKHQLVFKAADENGNEAEYHLTFNR